LLSGEDQSLLVRRDALLVLNLRFDIVDSVGRLNLEGYSLARKGLDEAGFQSLVFKVKVAIEVRSQTHICTEGAGKVSRAHEIAY